MKGAEEMLGCQIWLEPDDSKERVSALVREASKSGLGWLRCFLIWPWIESAPGRWDFRVFDTLFDAALLNKIKIKATLTANSGPWFLGTPSLLHSHTGFLAADWKGPMEKYIKACVTRYRSHPALGQWILWNEPNGGGDRTPETLQRWHDWLGKQYENQLDVLNRRWRTGFSSFDDIPFPEDLAHPAQRGNTWQSYRPWMDDCRFRSFWLASELDWVRSEVRRYDKVTPMCVNPCPFLDNQAANGVDLKRIAETVNVLGASYHPAWHFTYARREYFPALMAAGVRKTAAVSSRPVEVTEVQSGNTLNSSTKPCAVEPSELARFYLAGLFSGAQSVTGWLLNARSRDFEAGDWGLLDDGDNPSARSRMMKRLHDVLQKTICLTGALQPAPASAFIAYSLDAQAVEVCDTKCAPVDGRRTDDSARGQAMLNALLSEQGVVTEMRQFADLPETGGLLVLSDVVAWEEEDAKRILRFAQEGGTVFLDATSGRKNNDAGMNRPWPGFLSEKIGLRAGGLETLPCGYEVQEFGSYAGHLLLTRMVPFFDSSAGWTCQESLRYADGTPLLWERSYGQGRFVLFNGMAGPSLLYESKAEPILRKALNMFCSALKNSVRPLGGRDHAFPLPVRCAHGNLTAILGCANNQLRLIAPKGSYLDLWSGEMLDVGTIGEISVKAEDGIVLLWRK